MFHHKIREIQMSHNCLVNSNLNSHTHLLTIDIELAQKVKEQGCRHCGGALHQTNYPRIAFGVTAQIAPIYTCRFSYCCANCRRRTTPPSVRFFGRRRYISTIFIYFVLHVRSSLMRRVVHDQPDDLVFTYRYPLESDGGHGGIKLFLIQIFG